MLENLQPFVHFATICFQFEEDCLVLNINVPSNIDLEHPPASSRTQLPVMVYLHGGAFFFSAGTESMYNGRYLSNKTNAIVVTVNYRLGKEKASSFTLVRNVLPNIFVESYAFIIKISTIF